MAQATEIKASARPRSGKGGARAVRREGRVPGVVYGNGRDVENISLDYRELTITSVAASSCPPSSTSISTARRARSFRARSSSTRSRMAHARRLPARRCGRAHPRQRAGALHQRGPVARA